MIDPLNRIDVHSIEQLIEDHRYFVLHAPRQTGKTTCLLALMQHLNTQGRYRALYVNIEGAQAARGDVDKGIAAICSAFVRSDLPPSFCSHEPCAQARSGSTMFVGAGR